MVTVRTRRALEQIQHCGRSCTGPNSQRAGNSSARVQEAIFSKNGTAP